MSEHLKEGRAEGRKRPDSVLWDMLSVALLLCLIFFACLKISDFGMGWDEATRWSSGDNKLNYYKEIIEAENPLEAFGSPGIGRYPGLFDLSLSFAHSITGLDRFVLGHWWSFGFGFVGLLSVWSAARIVGGRRLAFFAAMTLVMVPSFFGHLFHNPKDIPFGAMYMLAIAAMTAFASKGCVRWTWALTIGLAIGLAMSVRVAGIVLYAYLAVTLLLILLREFEFETFRSKRNMHLLVSAVAFMLISVVVGGIVLMFWWPVSHGRLFSATGGTFVNLHSRASDIPLLFRGHVAGASEAPAFYVIWMLLIKLPLIHLIGLAAAVFYGLRTGITASTTDRFLSWVRVWPLLLGAIFPIIYMTATSPDLHNGMRHFLFAVLPLCVISAWGMLEVWSFVADRVGEKTRAWLQAACWLLFLSPLVALYQLHPYQYVFYNGLIGGTSASYGRYETEYWFTSTKHALEWLDTYLEDSNRTSETVSVFVSGSQEVAAYCLPEGMTLAHWSTADYLIVNTQMAMDQLVQGEELHVIERAGLPIVYIRRRVSLNQE